MKIYICDDELQILKNISVKVKKILGDCVIEEFTDGKSLLNALEKSGCDVLLLDIDMPDINGLAIAERLKAMLPKIMQESPLLVFVTSHDELVYDSFRVHPFGFIRKSCMDAELEKILRDCEKELSGREQFFTFKCNSENIRLKLREIFYFESDQNYLKLYTKQKVYRFRGTIGAVEEMLSNKGFIRFHRGFLINQEAVKVLGADEMELTTGEKIPIGRNYGEAAKKQLMRYMLK